MSHPKPEYKEIINKYKIQAETILQENRNFLDELRQGLKVKEDFSAELLSLLDVLFWENMDKGPLEKLIQIEKVYAACAIIIFSQGIGLKGITDEDWQDTFFLLGFACGTLEKHDPELTPKKLYADHYHSLKSKREVEKRWEKPKKQLKEALEIADQKWKDGEESWNYEMNEYLLDMKINGRKRFPDLTRGMLKKGLNPIARKYNRLFGLKGVTKKSSPMKKS
jgi:RNAse (barnase) inhibitor barstar